MRTLALLAGPLFVGAFVLATAMVADRAPTPATSIGLTPSGPATGERGEYSWLAADLPERVAALDLGTAEAVQVAREIVDASVELRAERDRLAMELELSTALVADLQRRGEWLQLELDLCGADVPGGPLSGWLPMLAEHERPSREALVAVAGAMRSYPGVILSPDEGLWIAQRFELDDWKAYARTIDEALINFLGPARIAAQVTPERLAELRAEWAEEGLF